MSRAPRTAGPTGTDQQSASPWERRIVDHAVVAPSTLLAHPQNWRRHPEAQRRAMRAVLDDVGWVQSVIVNRETGHILDGHLRVEEAVARGEALVPVGYVELTAEQERRVLALFDPIGALASPDPAALADLLASFEVTDGELKVLLADLAASAGVRLPALVDPDEVLPLPEPDATYVRRGQVWQLGAHRLGCGDALDPADVARLLAGARPTLLATDPPYGVGLDLGHRHGPLARPRRGSGHHQTAMLGDARADWSAAYELVPSLEVGYIWHPALTAPSVTEGLIRIGFEPVSEVIWVKSRWTVGRRWYHWQHEGCLVVRRTGSKVRFLGGRAQGTVWEAPSPKVGGVGADPKADHPSQKPVLLFERPIRNHLEADGIVYDPFLGSGTTLIAAEITGRTCHGLELDPRFAQLTLERWQAITGRRAALVDEP
jgi:DNA modification methylase